MEKQFKRDAEDGEMLKELESEILALRDENNYYKKIFADKNNFVTDLRSKSPTVTKKLKILKKNCSLLSTKAKIDLQTTTMK